MRLSVPIKRVLLVVGALLSLLVVAFGCLVIVGQEKEITALNSKMDALGEISAAKSFLIEDMSEYIGTFNAFTSSLDNPNLTDAQLEASVKKVQEDGDLRSTFENYIRVLNENSTVAEVRTNVFYRDNRGCIEFVNDGTNSTCSSTK